MHKHTSADIFDNCEVPRLVYANNRLTSSICPIMLSRYENHPLALSVPLIPHFPSDSGRKNEASKPDCDESNR